MVFGLSDDDKKNNKGTAAVQDDDTSSNDQAADAKAALDELKAKEKSDSEDCAFC